MTDTEGEAMALQDLIDDLRSSAESIVGDYYIDGDFDAMVRNHPCSQAADLIATLSRQLAEAQEVIERQRKLLHRYRNETPLGHQPHMIASEVDAALSQSAAMGSLEAKPDRRQ